MIDKRNTRNGKNTQTQHERNTTDDMDETRTDGDDDDEGGNSEDANGEYVDGAGSAGDGTASQSKRRQDHSFYFTTGVVKRIQSKEDGTLTTTCQVRMTRQHLAVPATSASPERLFSSVGLVKIDLWGRLLDNTLIDVMWAKQTP